MGCEAGCVGDPAAAWHPGYITADAAKAQRPALCVVSNQPGSGAAPTGATAAATAGGAAAGAAGEHNAAAGGTAQREVASDAASSGGASAAGGGAAAAGDGAANGSQLPAPLSVATCAAKEAGVQRLCACVSG